MHPAEKTSEQGRMLSKYKLEQTTRIREYHHFLPARVLKPNSDSLRSAFSLTPVLRKQGSLLLESCEAERLNALSNTALGDEQSAIKIEAIK